MGFGGREEEEGREGFLFLGVACGRGRHVRGVGVLLGIYRACIMLDRRRRVWLWQGHRSIVFALMPGRDGSG